MNQEIAISVKNKIAETDFSEVVSFNSVYRLKFDFDEEWDEYPSRVAVVMWAGGAAEKLFTGTECVMPQISSMDADTVLIGAYSKLGEKRIASSFVRLRCEAGAGGFPQPKPTATLHEQVLSFLNEKDWSLFADKVAEGIYSAVRVNRKGLVTEGKKIIEVSKDASASPADLAPGGVFFRLKDGVYTLYYYNGNSLEELTLTSGNLGHTLKIGEQSFNGTADVTVTLGKLAKKDLVQQGDLSTGCVTAENLANGGVTAQKLGAAAVITEKIADKAVSGSKLADDAVKAGDHTAVSRDESGSVVVSAKDVVFSVNGERGDVVIDQDSLGLADVAYSGNYRDLIGAPDTGVYSVNGQTGRVWIDKDTLGLADIAISGSYYDLVDAPESGVFSVNGQTGNVTLTGEALGLAKVATSGSYNDLTDKPTFEAAVTSVNGLTGDVMLTRSDLGLGALATKDLVMRDDLSAGCIGSSELRSGAVLSEHLSSLCVGTKKLEGSAVTTPKIAENAVTGAKIADETIKAGTNISVTRDKSQNFVISTEVTTGVTSVNGQTGDVTVDKQSMGLGSLTADRQFPLINDAESATDFNDLTSGAYCVIGSSSHVWTHFPISLENLSGSDCVWFLLAISDAAGSHCVQFAVSGKKDGIVCTRTMTDGAWTNWMTVNA